MRRLLIVGCGDVGLRLLPLVVDRYPVYALVRSEQRRHLVRSLGATPLSGDLDAPETLTRLEGVADEIVHMAPPPAAGDRDSRTTHLLQALGSRRSLPRGFVYMSTSGVYGDCAGELVPETRPLRPQSDRALRRADAERQVRRWATARGVRLSVLRVPGIYAADRLPLDRLRAGTPTLSPESDPFTNHVHADDLARMVVAALLRGAPGRTYNASDHSQMRMGEYFDLVAGRFGLARPPRIPLEEALTRLSPALLSFMRESRRLTNQRLCRELRFRFRHPTVESGVSAAAESRDH